MNSEDNKYLSYLIYFTNETDAKRGDIPWFIILLIIKLRTLEQGLLESSFLYYAVCVSHRAYIHWISDLFQSLCESKPLLPKN